jgi:hypothetical protein
MAATYLMAHTAEREGFEPSVRFLTLHSLSKRAPSASRSSLLIIRGGRLASPQSAPRHQQQGDALGGHRRVPPGQEGQASCRPTCSSARLFNCQTRIPAEEEGFEPPSPLGDAVFKTAAFNRSATPPCSCQRTGVRDSASPYLCKAESRGGARSGGVAVGLAMEGHGQLGS